MVFIQLAVVCSIYVICNGNVLDSCNKTTHCLKKPKDCVSFDTDCTAATIWSYNSTSSKLDVQIMTKDKWVGFGQVLPNSTSKMTNLFGAYCVTRTNGTHLGLFKATGKKAPKFIEIPNNSEVTASSMGKTGNVISCSFSRSLGVGSEGAYLHPLNNADYLAVMAFGTTVTGDLPTYHGYGSYVFTDAPVAWQPNVEPVTTTPTTSTPTASATTSPTKVTTTPTTSTPTASAKTSPTKGATTTKGSSGRVEKAYVMATILSFFVIQLF